MAKMAPRTAAGLLRIVKKPAGKRRTPGVTTTILFLTALTALVLLAMELSVLRSHSSSKQAVTKKKALLQNLRRYAPGDDPGIVIASRQSSPRPAEQRAGSARLKGERALTDRLLGSAPSGITELLSSPLVDDSGEVGGEDPSFGQASGGAERITSNGDLDLRSEEEDEAEALAGMGIAVDSGRDESELQRNSFIEPPIVQPLSGLKQHGGAAHSVVSNRQRTAETHHEKAAQASPVPRAEEFIFSGDLPGEEDFAHAVGRKVAAGHSPKSRASEAVARAKEKAAIAKARHGRGMLGVTRLDEHRANLLQALESYEAARQTSSEISVAAEEHY